MVKQRTARFLKKCPRLYYKSLFMCALSHYLISYRLLFFWEKLPFYNYAFSRNRLTSKWHFEREIKNKNVVKIPQTFKQTCCRHSCPLKTGTFNMKTWFLLGNELMRWFEPMFLVIMQASAFLLIKPSIPKKTERYWVKMCIWHVKH